MGVRHATLNEIEGEESTTDIYIYIFFVSFVKFSILKWFFLWCHPNYRVGICNREAVTGTLLLLLAGLLSQSGFCCCWTLLLLCSLVLTGFVVVAAVDRVSSTSWTQLSIWLLCTTGEGWAVRTTIACCWEGCEPGGVASPQATEEDVTRLALLLTLPSSRTVLLESGERPGERPGAIGTGCNVRTVVVGAAVGLKMGWMWEAGCCWVGGQRMKRPP